MKAELFLDCRQELAEGPVWYRDFWWWVDIEGSSINQCKPDGSVHVSKKISSRPCAAVPAADGRWLVAHENGFGFFDWGTGRLEIFNECLASTREIRMNDGKCDPTGRFWAGSMDSRGGTGGHLYRVDESLAVSVMLEGVSNSNGLAWSADTFRMYYIDTGTARIDVFDFDAVSGSLSGRRTLVDVPESSGLPDGMAIDKNDNLWVALWGGSAVHCYDGLSGSLLERVECGTAQITSCCFGGPDLDQLLITSARLGVVSDPEGDPCPAGSLWIAVPGVRGTHPVPFSDSTI